MTKSSAYRFRGRFHRVVDGDTYELDLDLAFGVGITVTARLRGVDCPEMDTKAGKAAKAFVEEVATRPGLWPLIVETSKDKHGEGIQTFARWVADVWLADGQSLAKLLVQVGHARVIGR